MSERTVADDTLTPGASTTCWDPTGWADPMYSLTTALRIAALRASRSPAAGCGWSLVGSSGGLRWGRTDGSGRSRGSCWHSILVSAYGFGPTTPSDGRRWTPGSRRGDEHPFGHGRPEGDGGVPQDEGQRPVRGP